MNYAQFLPFYPVFEANPRFQQQLYNKKEFRDLRLVPGEAAQAPGLLKHQEIIQRFMSPYTLYPGLFVYHEMGTGKSCVAFAVTENLKESYKHAIVLAKSDELLKNLMRQLVYTCTDLYTHPPKGVTVEEEMRLIRKQLRPYYRFETFEKFTKPLKNLVDSPAVIQNLFSNCVFVVDEVHNIRSNKKNDKTTYDILHSIFHMAEHTRILLLSGTPMRNSPADISWVMNLILPLNLQLPHDEQFYEDPSTLQVYFEGRVSYLQTPPSGLELVFRGETIGEPGTPDVAEFNVVPLALEGIQESGYMEAFDLDLGRENFERDFALELEQAFGEFGDDVDDSKTGFYFNALQASLFVFPNGEWGSKGYNQYASRSRLNPELIEAVRPLTQLAHHSCKYAAVIKDILAHPNQLIYVYCSAVKGSGLELFSQILMMYGYQQAVGDFTRRKERRFILLTGGTRHITSLIKHYNSDANAEGDYCHVVLGSRKISEGFTFKNIQRIHILTLHWNYTQTAQAIARGVRYGSHRALLARGIQPKVEIFQYAAIPESGDEDSLDLRMNSRSRTKDLAIKQVDRVIKTASVDCPLTYTQNAGGVPFSRGCDYQECEYVCDSFQNPNEAIDLNTYQLYYNSGSEIRARIIELFQSHTRLTYNALHQLIKPLSDFLLLTALAYLIEHNVPIVTTSGVSCYLREDQNTYFILDNAFLPNEVTLTRYTEEPVYSTTTSVTDLIQQQFTTSSIISKISKSTTAAEFATYMAYLPLELQETYLEAILSSDQEQLQQFVKETYERFLLVEEDGVISTLLPSNPRRLDISGWHDAPKPPKNAIEENPYGYYGIVQGDNFCIRDLSMASKDKRKQSSGAKCEEAGWPRPKLIKLLLHLGVEAELSEGQTLEEYWEKKPKKEMCKRLHEWFAEHNLLVEGQCGVRGKKKG
jgi:hypothetical protein